jgi:acyl-ACP thioesterase
MSGITTKKDFRVHNDEVDYLNNLLPEVILSYMQDTAMEQSESIGLGLEYLKEHKLHWILTRYHIKIQTYPKYNDKVTVSTKAVGFNKVFAFRDFNMTDGEGKTLITGNSQWLLIDGVTGKMLKIGEDVYEAYGIDKVKKTVGPFGKLTQPQRTLLSNNFSAGESDIDFNGHVNNKRYIGWALDTIPEDVLQKHTLSEFDIVFKKEVLLNQNIYVNTDIVGAENSLNGYHDIINENEEVVCCINTSWK